MSLFFQDQCALAVELKGVRRKTIQAAKALARARYRKLKGVNLWKGSPKGCVGAYRCSNQRWVTFVDQTTKISNGYLISDFFLDFLEPIEKNTTKWIWEGLVSKVNEFFNKTDVYCPSKYPALIRKSEVDFTYPSDCMGMHRHEPEKYGRCTLPCQYYAEGDYNCPLFLGHRIPRNNRMTDNDWGWCNPDPYFLKCMPVQKF